MAAQDQQRPDEPLRDQGELESEQAFVAMLYARLDLLREQTAAQLARTRREGPSGTHQNRSERDSFATLYEDRLKQLWAVESRLCFGRMDLRGGTIRHIGRIGLSDETNAQLLLDWRAPAAQDFYQATAASPGDVVRRRHLIVAGREVTDFEDDVLAVDTESGSGPVTGDAALLAAVTAPRTGRMGDIVATIQAEQDKAIRSSERGVLVVQGGPGTGKTAVALHRTAYLLYTHRDRLARSGVLLVGPSPVFLRYIEQVLPALGETGVVMSTPAELYPGVDADGIDSPEAAGVKGDLRMVDVLLAAVRARQRVPERPVTLDVDGSKVVLRPSAVQGARSSARRGGKAHNDARTSFVKEVLNSLAGQLAASQGTKLDSDNREQLLAELREARDVRREVNLLWMPLSPQRVLADLFASPRVLASAAGRSLSRAEQALLHRERGAAWTPADAALLDELAELLGDDDTASRADTARRAADREEQVSYAQQVLDNAGGGHVSAEDLAERFTIDGPTGTVAERAAVDRTWAFGHVVVDEAQELSPMVWRILMRRCPSKSMTIVGDVAQTSAVAGASRWSDVLEPYVEDRWRLVELTVNYRTPAQIAAVAAAVLSAAGVRTATPTAVRDGNWPPTAVSLPETDEKLIARVVAQEFAILGEGRMAVIVPGGAAATQRIAVATAQVLPPNSVGAGTTALDEQVAVLTIEQCKGLEFDAVVLVEPSAMLAESKRGANDLYVALTRATQRLTVAHATALPAGMESLTRREL